MRSRLIAVPAQRIRTTSAKPFFLSQDVEGKASGAALRLRKKSKLPRSNCSRSWQNWLRGGSKHESTYG